MNAIAPTERALARWENEGGAASHERRQDFPGVLDWHYLDTAATAQKPQVVLDAMMRAGGRDYATVHRGVYARSANMTVAFEAARERVGRFIGAASPNEIVFVRGATEGINLVANSWGNTNLKAGDRIMLSQLEHHSNIVPWQMLASRVGAHIDVCPLTADGLIDLDWLEANLTERHKLIALPTCLAPSSAQSVRPKLRMPLAQNCCLMAAKPRRVCGSIWLS
jgi:cysteine desulfurase / selenocysteine lyase